jgi:cysteine desulfurase
LPFIKDMERFMLYLSEKNICLSRFSACNSKLSGSSKILLAMGRSRMRSQTSLRISFGRWSKLDDFYRLIRAIKSYTD